MQSIHVKSAGMKVTPARKLFVVFNSILMVALILVCFLPFWHMCVASVSDPNYVRMHTGLMVWPSGFNIMGYKLVLSKDTIMAGFRNSLFITVFGTSISMFISCLGAYVLSKRGVYWNKWFMKMITVTMFIGGGLVPFYMVVQAIGLFDSLWAFIIPYCLSTWNMLVMRSSFRALPDSLEESASIDGATDFTILFRIVVPLSLPVMAVMVLFYALSYWGSWFPGVLFIRSMGKQPLQLIMRGLLINNETTAIGTTSEMAELSEEYYLELVKYVTIVIATAPIIIVYPFLQKYFVTGIMVGSLKE